MIKIFLSEFIWTAFTIAVAWLAALLVVMSVNTLFDVSLGTLGTLIILAVFFLVPMPMPKRFKNLGN